MLFKTILHVTPTTKQLINQVDSNSNLDEQNYCLFDFETVASWHTKSHDEHLAMDVVTREQAN